MPFVVPTFNLSANVWRNGNATTNPPDLTVDCQLRAAGKQSTGQDPANGWAFLWSLLIASGTDIRDDISSGGKDTVECPAGTGRFYSVELVDDVARGFSNEYRIAFIQKVSPWPVPTP